MQRWMEAPPTEPKAKPKEEEKPKDAKSKLVDAFRLSRNEDGTVALEKVRGEASRRYCFSG